MGPHDAPAPPGDSAPEPSAPPRPPTHSMSMSHLGDALPALALANTYVAAARGRGRETRGAPAANDRGRDLAAPAPGAVADRSKRPDAPLRAPARTPSHAVPAHRPAPRAVGTGTGTSLVREDHPPSGSASADPPAALNPARGDDDASSPPPPPTTTTKDAAKDAVSPPPEGLGPAPGVVRSTLAAAPPSNATAVHLRLALPHVRAALRQLRDSCLAHVASKASERAAEDARRRGDLGSEGPPGAAVLAAASRAPADPPPRAEVAAETSALATQLMEMDAEALRACCESVVEDVRRLLGVTGKRSSERTHLATLLFSLSRFMPLVASIESAESHQRGAGGGASDGSGVSAPSYGSISAAAHAAATRERQRAATAHARRRRRRGEGARARGGARGPPAGTAAGRRASRARAPPRASSPASAGTRAPSARGRRRSRRTSSSKTAAARNREAYWASTPRGPRRWRSTSSER